MVNSVELMQLCRLCLVKDQVNIPIFNDETDVQQIFLKISTCLPVKVTQDDNLPKKICNDCSYKLDLCYQFWNTSANSEKQLLTWLNEVGLSQEALNEAKLQKTESNPTPGLVLKQEAIEPESESSHEVTNNVSTESQEYILQQQQLPYQTPSFPFSDDNFVSGEATNAGASKAHTNNKREATLKRKRQAVATVTQPDSDDDVDDEIDDPTETKVAKTEETSDDDRDDDCLNDEESTEFAGVPSTSTDNEQPGPSGLGKNVVDAPLQQSSLRRSSRLSRRNQNNINVGNGTFSGWSCGSCFDVFSSLAEYKKHKNFHKTVAATVLKREKIFPGEKSGESSDGSAQSSDDSDETESEYEASESSSAPDSDDVDVSWSSSETVSSKNSTTSQNKCSSKAKLKSGQTTRKKHGTGGIIKINPWNCTYCNVRIKPSYKMLEHLQEKHSNEKCFRCTMCPKDGFSFEELQKHLKNCHPKIFPVQRTLIKSFDYDSTNTRHNVIKITSNNNAEKKKICNNTLDKNQIDINQSIDLTESDHDMV